MEERRTGSPQGSVVSPLLSNVVLHHVFDNWMANSYPNVPFTRYADDALAHCETRKQADHIRDMISRRFTQHMLKVHPEMTKIVYCKDRKRVRSHEHEQFDFLGYAFRPRTAKTGDGRFVVGFLPGMSPSSGKKIRATIRGWRLNLRSAQTLEQIATEIKPSPLASCAEFRWQTDQGWHNCSGLQSKRTGTESSRFWDRINCN